MLFQKLKEDGRCRPRNVIGLMGVHPGAGVTYTSIIISFFMGKNLGRKTALLECNRRGDFDLLQKAFHWSKEEENFFSYHNIDFYKNANSSLITKALSLNYESYILDFGNGYKENKEEFLRCDLKIIICGHAEWNQQRLIQFMDKNEMGKQNSTWKILIPCANKKDISRLRDITKQWVDFIPYQEDPTKPTKELIKKLRKLFV